MSSDLNQVDEAIARAASLDDQVLLALKRASMVFSPPTAEAIAQHLGRSEGDVVDALARLSEHGMIEEEDAS